MQQLTDRSPATSPAPGLFANDRLSDLIGFCFFAALAVWTVAQMPTLSVWLLPTFAHELFVAIAFVIRDRARAAAPSAASRITAYGGTLIIVAFMHVSRVWKPEWLSRTTSAQAASTGTVLWLAGSLVVVVSIWWLRRAFSIEPEARRMITSGPYRFARHPIYSGYGLQYVGLWMNYPSAALAVVLTVWVCLTLARIHFEERVLSSAFPEYAGYRQTVGALGPRLSPFLGSRAA
jgi:protein-S-isoprenylcysteine O-methyltransferase Ste14